MKKKILFLSDIHLGKSRSSEKMYLTWDDVFIFENFVEHIIKDEVFLIVDCGDFFDEKIIKNEILKYIHLKIISKLRNNGIGYIVIAGNHDTYDDINKVSSMEDLNYYKSQNITVIDTFSAYNGFNKYIMDHTFRKAFYGENVWFKENVEPILNKYQIGFSFFPYNYPSTMKSIYYAHKYNINTQDEKWPSVKRGITFENLQTMISEIQESNIGFLESCEVKFQVGHYPLYGCKARYKSNEDSGEFKFTNSMVMGDKYNYCIYGHYHKPQKAFNSDNVFHIGSFNFVKFDEEKDEKRYMEYNCETKEMKSISLTGEEFSIRLIKNIEIEIPKGCESVNSHIIEKIKEVVNKETKYKIKIKGYKSDVNKVNYSIIYESIINDVFFVSFEIDVLFEDQTEINKNEQISSISLTAMWEEFTKKYKKNPDIEDLALKGLNAMQKAKENQKIIED